MILRNTLNFINKSFENVLKKIRKIYLSSDFYEKKISKCKNQNLIYKPSPHLLYSLINYQKKKINVNDIVTENLWNNENININNFKKLNNFYWFLVLILSHQKKIHKILFTNG